MENNPTSIGALSEVEIHKIEEYRKSKQTAILAILFSDIVDSTYATEKLGEHVYSKLRHVHDELFKKIMCRDQAGIIIKEIGDSFLCVFSEPSMAVLRAIEFQQAILNNKEHLSAQGFTVSVKIGIHVGQVAVENSFAMDIFGRHVNRASRIEALANGGQILTSLSVWENAVGWLKSNHDENIQWIAHGKTTLKGVEEKVEIFEFYSNKGEKPAVPKIIKKQKFRRTMMYVSLFSFLLLTSLFAFYKYSNFINSETSGINNERKSYYVQFDFSDFDKNTAINSDVHSLDTLKLGEELLTEIINLFSKDSIITDSELINSTSKEGKMFSKKGFGDKNFLQSIKYFRDTLNISGVILVKAANRKKEKEDFIDLQTNLIEFDSIKGYSSAVSSDACNLENVSDKLRNQLQDNMISNRHWTVQGYVISCNDSLLIFRLSNEASVKAGVRIRLMREFKGIEGLEKRQQELKKRIDYNKINENDSSLILKQLYQEFKKNEKLEQKEKYDGGRIGIFIRGVITNVYDTTARAKWKLDEESPPEYPEIGDIIYFD